MGEGTKLSISTFIGGIVALAVYGFLSWTEPITVDHRPTRSQECQKRVYIPCEEDCPECEWHKFEEPSSARREGA